MKGPVKGFRQSPTPTKGEVLAQNAEIAGNLAQDLAGLKANVQFLGQMATQTLGAVRGLAPEVDALTTLEAANVVQDAAKAGDHVMMDYIGILLNEDGSPDLDADGIPNYQQSMTGLKFCLRNLGGGSLIPGFEEAIVGKTAGQNFEIVLTFPENYGVKELVNKQAKFLVHVHRIYRPLSVSVVEETIRRHQAAKTAILEAKKAQAEAAEAPKAE